MKRVISMLLCGSMILSLLPGSALAAGEGQGTLHAHEGCGAAREVGNYSELKDAIQTGSGSVDLLLLPGENWTADGSIAIGAGKTVHLRVAPGERVTITRGGACTQALFQVAAGGRLILGDGRLEYTGESLEKAAQAGSYAVKGSAGKLILDGGAVWKDPVDWTPGPGFEDSTGKSAVLYDETGEQKKYTNGGLVTASPLIASSGTLDIWSGVTLQNNVATNDAGAAIRSGQGSTLNLYGGEISLCAQAQGTGDTGRGAVFVGNFVAGNWNEKVEPTDTHFHMYGGKITRNAASGGNTQDGGGVSVEQAYMDLYGGEISYNHAGVRYEAASGDGGGVMVRNGSQFHMWGGSVENNFAGGYGGGIVAWNAEIHIHGGQVTRNKAAYGGGLAIASSNNANGQVSARATMDGGLIASNEAINTTADTAQRAKEAGVGGGICVGSGSRTEGSTLALSGGEIRQNTAVNGGGLGVYAGGGQGEGALKNTSVTLSGDFRLISNFADQNGNGMYITNMNTGNRHYLVKMSGGARVDTNNPVYFANLCKNQVPVQVGETLTGEGAAAIFEFADSFWSGKDVGAYDKASSGRKVVDFAPDRDVQENKIALESAAWRLYKKDSSLALQDLSKEALYTIRNGTPVKVGDMAYYRIYSQLSDAFREAESGDILYIYYNTTVDTAASLPAGKTLTLMAESTSSAGRAASLSGKGQTKTCWLEYSDYGYDVMRGNFLKYVGSGGDYNKTGGAAADGAYKLDSIAAGATAYNIRNDYTITLSSRILLGETAKGGSGAAAVVVAPGATLEIGQTATAGMGAGTLTFDGNLSSPKEGPLLQTGGTLRLHSGVTVKNHSNYSLAHPGAVEVLGGGSLTMDEGVSVTGNVSPVAGGVYVAPGGSFTMEGGSISDNRGAMPRYGFFTSAGTRLSGYDTAYWGQAKYYSGAGAVYNRGSFAMKGGQLSGNRGEYGALANFGTLALTGGAVTGNAAQRGTGEGEYALAISGYREGASPAIPTEAAYSPNAGSGGGLYQGSVVPIVIARGVTLSGNTAVNGGGVAVGKGRDTTWTVNGYANVTGGYEKTASGQVQAKVPQYKESKGIEPAGVELTVSEGAALTENEAWELGGGLWVSGTGSVAGVDRGAVLRGNSAQKGGGGAAGEGGSLSFSNEVTENTARLGGGIYVSGGGSVTARGSLTSNEAQSGAGAYVDRAEAGSVGRLTLDGARVNNNRLAAGEGFGAGIYSRGDVVLTAEGGSQPSVSYNDRIYLAQGRVVTLAASYDVTQSGQSENNRLTLESEQTENDTPILRAFSEEQALATLASGWVTHYTHPLAQDQEDKKQLEINAVPVYYYDRFAPEGGLESHRVEVPYAQGSTVIFQNFSVGEDRGFVLPTGMSFLYWVTMDRNGQYLDSAGQVVDTPQQAQTYYAGNTISNLSGPIYLEAVYGTVTYTATLQILDKKGNVASEAATMGSIALGGANYNSGTGEYSYAMGTNMTVSVLPSDGTLYGQTVLQGLRVYEEETQQSGSEDLYINGIWWRPVAWAEMEEETLDVPGGGLETLASTGRIREVKTAAGTVAGLDGNGNLTYTASDKRILVRARFKPAMVRLDMAEKDFPISYTGYYDTMHEAVTAVTDRIGKGHKTEEYTLTLLQNNGMDADGNGIVLYYGEKGETPENCLDNNVGSLLADHDEIRITYDLNGHILDYQHFGERSLKWYDMTIKNGTIVYHGNEDRTNPADPLPSAFRVAEGTLSLERVTIRTTGTPQGGYNDKVYSAKVMEKGTLNIGRGCTLGDVFVYTDRSTIGAVGPDGTSEGSGHVTVTDTFLEGRTQLVATLCLRYWDFENQVRRVLVLDDSVAAREGVSIRRMFDLKDVSSSISDGRGDNSAYWFIGTDGKLYKKAYMVIPDLKAENHPGRQEPLKRYWDYKAKNGYPEIGLSGSAYPGLGEGEEPAWIGGYPFFYDYISTYGFSSETSVELTSQLVDGWGEPLKVDRGNVSFTVVRVTIQEDGERDSRRIFSGTTGLEESGAASLPFPFMSSLPVTGEVDLVDRKMPSSFYIVSASWTGAGQYAPAYAEYWNYAQGARDEQAGILGGTLNGDLRLSVQRKEISSTDVEVVSVTPYSVEFIGEEGRANGYTSAPSVGRVVDHNLDRVMTPGTDYNIYYAALTLTLDPDHVVKNAEGNVLECPLDGKIYYYIAGANGGKIYYRAGGAGTKDGTSPANAADLNGAPAGPYSVALEAETLPDSNYCAQSGFKNTLFTIQPYRSALAVQALNHVVAKPGEEKSEVITRAFEKLGNTLKITDRYGNQLPLSSCAFTFLPVSGKAELDAEGWPKVAGLYNIEVTAKGHGKGTMKLSGVDTTKSLDANYAETVAGYLAMLVTDEQLPVFFVPETVDAPYTGDIYTSDMVKALDGEGYEVWKTGVDENGNPVDVSGNVIGIEEIPTKGAGGKRIDKAEYRLEIGSPRNTPREAGSYTMVLTDVSGAYVGIGTLHITTETIADISLSESVGVYTGVDHTPEVTVRDTAGHVLTRNRDFVVHITDKDGNEVDAPINAGEYTYTAVGINNYVGSGGAAVTAGYEVKQKDLGNGDTDSGVRGVILDAPNYAISDGSAVVPRYSLYYNGMTLVRGSSPNADYTQTIAKGAELCEMIRDAGSYTITVTGKGNYRGSTSFVLTVAEADKGKLKVTNTGQYTYTGGNFDSYNWQQSAVVNLTGEGMSSQSLDAYKFEVSLQRVGASAALEPVDPSSVLDAGVYLLTLVPTEDYAGRIDGLEADDSGSCVFQIQRRPVTIQIAQASKIYGQLDPDLSRVSYATDLSVEEPTGFFAHDTDRISGQFGRNTGENVRNGGYRYTLGSFTAGDNYVLTVNTESVFMIEPKDITVPSTGTDEIVVEKREYLSYTGYALTSVQSVTYKAQRRELDVAAQASYLLTYERWVPGSEGCTPSCALEGCSHGWENVTAVPTDVGWYRITIDADACITSPDNYVGKRSFLFEVRVQGGALDLAVEGADTVTYTGEDHIPTVTVKREGFVLAQEYYALSYSFAPADGGPIQAAPFLPGRTAFREAGVYTVYAAGSGNYAGSVGSVSFTIRPKSLAPDDTVDGTAPVAAQVSGGQSFVYNGKAQQAGITASYGGTALTEKKDYTLSYQNHVNAGEATVTITGQGNYTGERVLTYPIGKQALEVTVAGTKKIYGAADPVYTYTIRDAGGAPVSPRLTGSVGRQTGEDAGSYPLDIGTLSAGDNYTLALGGSAALTIGKKSLGNGLAAAQNISVRAPGYMAESSTGAQMKEQLAVTYWAPALGEKQLEAGTDYAVAVTDEGGAPVSDGAALAAGEYTLTVTGAGTNFDGGFALTIKVVGADSLIDLGGGKTLTYRLKGQQERVIPRVGDQVLEGCTITVTANYARGGSQTLHPLQDAEGGFDLTLTDAGVYTVVATRSEETGEDKQVYFGTVTYVVQPKDISDPTSGDGLAGLAEPEGDFSYTGQEVIPANAHTLLRYGGETIPAAEGDVVNYIVGCSGNVNPGRAAITVYGQGNYTGTLTAFFQVGEIRYQVSYDGNGAVSGTPPQDNALYMKGDMATVMGNVNGLTGAPGTVFLGWSDSQLGLLTQRGEEKSIYVSGSLYPVGEENVTLYAVWAADENRNGKADCDEDKYTVTYQYAREDGCTGILPTDPAPHLSGTAVAVAENIGSLALPGYLLLGWVPLAQEPDTLRLDNSEDFFTFVSAHDLYAAGRDFTMGGGDLVLYAVWGADANGNGTVDWMESKVQYFVSYDANGGTGALPPSKALPPEALSLTVAPDFDASGLTFTGRALLGWSPTRYTPLTERPEPESYHTSGETYVIPAGAANPVVLYALWAVDENGNGTPDYEEARYTVSFENVCPSVTAGAGMPSPAENRLEGVRITLPQAAGVIGGKAASFLGWTTDRAEGEKLYLRGQAPEGLLAAGEDYTVGGGDATLYAVWGEESYHVERYTVTVTPSPNEGGKAEASASTVLAGGESTVTIEVSAGYALSQVLVNGKAADELDWEPTGRAAALKLEDITEHKSVVVTFVRSQLRVVWPNAAVYDQKRQEPELHVYRSDNSGTQVEATHYTLSVTRGGEALEESEAYINAGSYTVTVKGKEGGEYEGSQVQVPYTIAPAVLTELTLKEGPRVYKGADYDDEIRAVKAGELTVPAEGYTAVYSNNRNVGTATVAVAGKGNYTGTLTGTFSITAATGEGSLSAAFSATPSLTYDGKPHTPAPTVKYGQTLLSEKVDYTLTYPDDVTAAGEKTVTVTGKGNFAGASASVTYTVKEKSLGATDKADGTAPVTALAVPDQAYTGSKLEPGLLLLYGSGPALTLTKDVDYTAAYEDNTAVGTATVTITGAGNYTGSRTLSFKIAPASGTLTAAERVTRTYNGRGTGLDQAELSVKLGETELKEERDYTVAYTPLEDTGARLDNDLPKTAGTYIATVTAKGNYSGTARTTLTVLPAGITELKTEGESFSYDGLSHTPQIKSVAAGTLSLGEGDYTVAYETYTDQGTVSSVSSDAPSQVGSYGMVVTGKGNFSGEKTAPFLITSGKALTVGTAADRVYDGLPYLPHPQVRDGERVLTENRDYSLEYPADMVNAGSKTIKVKGLGNYAGASGQTTCAITPKSLEDPVNVQVLISDQVYDGTAKTPDVTVICRTGDGRTLFLTPGDGKDYTVAYTGNTAVGTARVTVTGTGNYTGSRRAEFAIHAPEGKSLAVTVQPNVFTYDGSQREGTLTVKDAGTVLTENVDYTYTYEALTGTLGEGGKPLAVGTYTVLVKGEGNYAGALGRADLVIHPAALGQAELTESGLVYDGTEKEPAVTVKNAAGEVLTQDTDYTLTYQNNTDAGTASVTVAGTGNYTGTKVLTFPIAKAKLVITPTNTGKEYGAADGTLSYTAAARGEYHFEGALTREAGEKVDEYAFLSDTLRETSGNYELELAEDASFTITPKDIGDEATVTQTESVRVGYTGQAFDQAILTVYQAHTGDLMLSVSDYTVTYEKDGTEVSEAKEPGTYTVTVTGQGNYEGSYTFDLTIDNSILGVRFTAAGEDTVTYDGTDWASGMAGRLTASDNGTEVPLTDSDLSFQKGGSAVTELVDAGAYTVVVSVSGYDPVELPFLIQPRDIEDGAVVVSGLEDEPVYDGSAQEPEVTVADGAAGLVEGVNYTAEYQNNVNAGQARVILTGKGNYTGVRTETFSIGAKELADSEVESLPDVVYTGGAHLQKPVVTDLTEGTDYLLSYSGEAVDVGEVTATVTGIGNYSGRVERRYEITPRTIEEAWLTVSPHELTYTGSAQEPLVLVVDGRTYLAKGTDFALSFTDNVAVGEATAVVTGTGNYQGEAEMGFTIAASSAALSVSLSGNETVYNGEDQKPVLTVSSEGTQVEEYTAVYAKNGEDQGSFDADTRLVDAGVYTITVTGTGNFAGSTVTLTFLIRPASFTVEPVPEQDYTGLAVTPEPLVTDGNGRVLVNGVDYLLFYANNVALGEDTAQLTVTGLGNYAGTDTRMSFTITGKNTLYYVTYDGNGATAGTLPTDERGYLSGERFAVQSGGELRRMGALFLGWSRTRSDLVTSREAQEALSILQPGDTLVISANVTLYGVWAADSDHNGRPDYAERVVITSSAGEGGSIAPDGRHTVDWGTLRVEYTITADSGWTFSSLTVDGQRVAVSTPEAPTALRQTESGYTYAFTDVKDDHVILAAFRQNSGGSGDGGGGGGSGDGGGGGGGTGGGGSGGGGTLPMPPAQPELPVVDGPVTPGESGVDRWLIIDDHTAYMSGRDTGFAPNADLTRGEVAVLFYRLLKEKDVPITVSFTDVPEDEWYTDAALTLASVGIMKGVGEGRFEPRRTITRAEFAVIISRFAKEVEEKTERDYSDVDPEGWYYDGVQLAYHYGWMVGYPDGSFGVEANVTRAEAAKVVNYMTYRLADKEAIDAGAGARFADVPQAHWAFYEIVEASTTHNWEQTGGKETWQPEE